MPRVLHIINDLRVGGAEVSLADLAGAQTKTGGTDVTAMGLLPAESFLPAVFAERGVPVVTNARDIGFYSPRHVRPLSRYIARGGFDVVHVHLFPAQLWAALAVRRIPLLRRPLLVTTEHCAYNRRRDHRAFKLFDGPLYRAYDHIIAVGEATRDSLTAWLPATTAQTTVLYPAIDVPAFANAPRATKRDVLGLTDEATPVALCVGRTETQKDQATLLRALPALPGVHAALAGDGPLRPELEALARTFNIADRTHFLGRRSDVASLIKMADVYVQPSLFEGWSRAILEVMASGGTPIAATRAPGLTEAVEGRGLLSPIGDADALAGNIRALLGDALLRERLTGAARAYADGFRIEKAAREHLALYERLLAARRAA